ncbi:MAG: hypothetical protein WA208_21320, partial [Thermoanaerobaculia bacterium]
IGPKAVGILQDSLSRSLRTVFAGSAAMILLAMIVATGIPPGIAGSHRQPEALDDEGERFVIAEMTTLDPGHEPEADFS